MVFSGRAVREDAGESKRFGVFSAEFSILFNTNETSYKTQINETAVHNIVLVLLINVSDSIVSV